MDCNNIKKSLSNNNEIIDITRNKALKFLKLAKYQANLFSKDTTKVGCIFIDKNNFSILSCGYNGFIRNAPEPETRWIRPEKYTYVIHSELNGIINAARCGIKLDNSIVFVTMFPCSDCTKALLQVGISILVTIEPNLTDSKWSESFKTSQIMLKESNIKIILFNSDELL
jgi:dCMP deaminase